MKAAFSDKLGIYVLQEVQRLYLAGKIVKTDDCIIDMSRDSLYESDVEKVITEATIIEKVMPATSDRASSKMNTHYVINGESTNGKRIYCKLCTNYNPTTEAFICWKLTSFCLYK